MEFKRTEVDLAKDMFQIHGGNKRDKPVWRRRLLRKRWLLAVLETMEGTARSAWNAAVARTLDIAAQCGHLQAIKFAQPET